jgi:hypothetical protein
MKAIIINCCFLTFLPLLFFSCTKPDVKKKEIGLYSVCIDYGCTNPKKTANCEDAFATLFNDPSLGNIITLIGKFPDGSAIQFILLWDGGATNVFKFGDATTGSDEASYFPQFGQFQQYTTIDTGTDGTLTITELDQTNKRLNGTFSFKGKYFDGNNYLETFLNVSGSFTNIPIIDLANQSNFCQ